MNNSLSTPRIRNPRLRKLLSKKTAAKWMLALFRTVFIVGICFTILYPPVSYTHLRAHET